MGYVQKPICVDDFGVQIFKCRFTGELVGGDTAVTCGANIQGVHAVYVMGVSPESKTAKKVSDFLFNDSEGNCNTCSSLRRVPFKKRRDGLIDGICANHNSKHFGDITFHPNDPLHMPCYSPRGKLVVIRLGESYE